MFFARLFALAIMVLPFSLAAPMKRALDSATLLQNAKDAQTLNMEFSNLTKDSPCDAGQTACVNGSLAVCQSGSWKLTKCSDTQQCFAIPSLTSQGTAVTCTSQATALSLINGAGAQGDVSAPKDSNATVSFPTSPPLSNSTQSTASPAGKSAASSPLPSATAGPQSGVQVVTVTITQTLPPPVSTIASTTTLDASGVSSLFSSLSSSGATVVSSAAAAESTGASDATATLAPFPSGTPSSAASKSSALNSSSSSPSKSSSTSFAIAATILLTTNKAAATPISSTSSIGSISTAGSPMYTGYTRNYAGIRRS